MISSAPCSTAWTDVVRLSHEDAGDDAVIDVLVDQAFGPGRFAKTAERLREGATLRRDLSVCAWSGSDLIGAVRLWEIEVGGSYGLFLGPIAVRSMARGRGLGAAMAERACETAEAAGEAWVLLVGAQSFFAPLGFGVAPGVVLPGPVDPGRLLWKPLLANAMERPIGPAAPRDDGQVVRTPKRPAKLPSPMRG